MLSLSPLRRPALLFGVCLAAGCGARPALSPSASNATPAAVPAAATAPEDSARPATPEQMTRLTTELRTLLRQVPGQDAAAYVIDLPSGLTASVNGDRPFLAASIIKLGVMGAVYELWEKKPQLRTEKARQWMDAMITVSDNASTDHLVDMLGGPARVTAYCRRKGWPHLEMGSKILARPIRAPNRVTAREVTELLAEVDRRRLIGEEEDAEMWDMLLRQEKRNRIPAGVPDLPGVEVGNKTGTIKRVLHDAGIVHTPRARYALTVLISRQRSDYSGEKFCQKVSRLVFNHLHGEE